MLFNTTVFGPVRSRRLGVSLGVNLLPNNGKLCSFDCVYCECGLNKDGKDDTYLPTVEEVKTALQEALIRYNGDTNNPPIDTITFAGNGEPTLHPQFLEIVKVVAMLRDQYAPKAKISVLSNAWQLKNAAVVEALKLVDNNILKLDSAFKDTIIQINQPNDKNFSVKELIKNIQQFGAQCIVQTMFVKSKDFDNTQEAEVEAYLRALEQIKPSLVQLYSLDRKVPIEGLIAVDKETLDAIAKRIEALGISTLVTP